MYWLHVAVVVVVVVVVLLFLLFCYLFVTCLFVGTTRKSDCDFRTSILLSNQVYGV